MLYILAYGTLREGHYNFDRFEGVKKIATINIDGYQLYDLGAYPMILPDENAKNLVVDLLEVSEQTKGFIDRMEIGAGYKLESHTVNIDGQDYTATLYVYKSNNGSYEQIESNDYNRV